MADWQIHCSSCGRFMNPQTPGSSWVFVPSSDAPSYEEDRWQCAPGKTHCNRAFPEKIERPVTSSEKQP